MYVWLACRQYLKHNFRHYRNCSIHSREKREIVLDVYFTSLGRVNH